MKSHSEKHDKLIPIGINAAALETFDFQEFIPYLLNRVVLAVLPLFEVKLQEQQLPLDGWRILAVLHKLAPLRVRDLLRLTGIEPPTLSRTLASLERRKLVVRSPSEQDARGILVRATGEGLALANALIPHAIALQNAMLRDFSEDEIEFLIRLLRRLHLNLETGHPSPLGQVNV
jgi:DNA-binding MarR family transcriptional regulator